jgi:hypothetical protein
MGCEARRQDLCLWLEAAKVEFQRKERELEDLRCSMIDQFIRIGKEAEEAILGLKEGRGGRPGPGVGGVSQSHCFLPTLDPGWTDGHPGLLGEIDRTAALFKLSASHACSLHTSEIGLESEASIGGPDGAERGTWMEPPVDQSRKGIGAELIVEREPPTFLEADGKGEKEAMMTGKTKSHKGSSVDDAAAVEPVTGFPGAISNPSSMGW